QFNHFAVIRNGSSYRPLNRFGITEHIEQLTQHFVLGQFSVNVGLARSFAVSHPPFVGVAVILFFARLTWMIDLPRKGVATMRAIDEARQKIVSRIVRGIRPVL